MEVPICELRPRRETTFTYSWNSFGMTSIAFFTSSIAFEPSLSSGAMMLKRCQLPFRWSRMDYWYLSMIFSSEIATRSCDADIREKSGYIFALDSTVECDSNDT